MTGHFQRGGCSRVGGFLLVATLAAVFFPKWAAADTDSRPNILLVVADDWGWPHTEMDGSDWLATPAFNRVAREGVHFRQAFSNGPSCTPARGALLTGRYPWKLEEGSTLWGALPRDYIVLPDLLEAEGYKVGYTGKGWGPGRYSATGWTRNPAGPLFDSVSAPKPASGMSHKDYAANFDRFLSQGAEGEPFFFWFGPHEPHRAYEAGSGAARAGLDPALVEVPAFWPDEPAIRDDLLDYAFEVQHLDSHLQRMLAALEGAGELDNTLVIVTGDHGMPFPRCKANLYEYGIHVPLAVRWGERVPGGRVVDDLVSFIDLAPTILEAAGCAVPPEMQVHGRSVLGLLESDESGSLDPSRSEVVLGLERHGVVNGTDGGFPCRGLRTKRFLYIRNYETTWSPNVSDWGPTANTISPLRLSEDPLDRQFWEWNFGTRPAEELFDIVDDPECVRNLAADPAFAVERDRLRARCEELLRSHRDPRVLGYGMIFRATPYFSNSRRDLHVVGTANVEAAREALWRDDDGDGRVRLLDIALARDLVPNEPMRVALDEASGTAVLVYPRQKDRMAMPMAVQWSRDLVSWTDEGVVSRLLEDRGDHEMVEARVAVPEGGGSIYFRVVVEFDASNLD